MFFFSFSLFCKAILDRIANLYMIEVSYTLLGSWYKSGFGCFALQPTACLATHTMEWINGWMSNWGAEESGCAPDASDDLKCSKPSKKFQHFYVFVRCCSFFTWCSTWLNNSVEQLDLKNAHQNARFFCCLVWLGSKKK